MNQKLKYIAFSLVAGLIANSSPSYSQEAAPAACLGPKPLIAIENFKGTGNLAIVEGIDVDESLRAQLVTALHKKPCMVIINNSKKVQAYDLWRREQCALGLSECEAIRVPVAEYLVVGTVTEFEPSHAGEKVGGGILAWLFGIEARYEKIKAQLAFDIEVIRVPNRQSITSFRVGASAESTVIGGGLDTQYVSIGGEKYHKSSLLTAARVALSDAAEQVSAKLLAVPLTAQSPAMSKVVSVHGNQITLTGTGQFQVGERLQVVRRLKTLVDPDDDSPLGYLQEKIGEVDILSIINPANGLTLGHFRQSGKLAPTRGDIVIRLESVSTK